MNQAILQVAQAEADTAVTEWPPNTNRVKYWDWWYDTTGFLAGPQFSWCAAFVSWCAARAGTPVPPVNGDKGFTYCPGGVVWAYQHGEAVSEPEPGDIIIYSWYGWGVAGDGLPRVNDGGPYNGDVAGDHTGILVRLVGDGTLVAIEGNTSSNGSQDNGGAVLVKRRPVSQVCCWWRPASFRGLAPAATAPAGPTDEWSALMADPTNVDKLNAIYTKLCVFPPGRPGLSGPPNAAEIWDQTNIASTAAISANTNAALAASKADGAGQAVNTLSKQVTDLATKVEGKTLADYSDDEILAEAFRRQNKGSK